MGKYQPRGGRTDTNQTQIVRELRGVGFRVDNVSQLKRLYDLVVTGRTGSASRWQGEVLTLRVEIKIKGEGLSPAEQEYWDAEPFPDTLIIAYETEDILKWFFRI